jgi:alkylated DNA nucleotide flippase Atl1
MNSTKKQPNPIKDSGELVYTAVLRALKEIQEDPIATYRETLGHAGLPDARHVGRGADPRKFHTAPYP